MHAVEICRSRGGDNDPSALWGGGVNGRSSSSCCFCCCHRITQQLVSTVLATKTTLWMSTASTYLCVSPREARGCHLSSAWVRQCIFLAKHTRLSSQSCWIPICTESTHLMMGGHSTVQCEMHRMQWLFSDLHCALWKDRIIGFGWRRDPQIGPLIVDTASMLVTLRIALGY